MRANRGFTLLEIMIAVAVFAIVGAALVRNAALTVRQTGLLQDKTVALWIAENELASYHALPRTPENFPGTGTRRTPVTMAGEDWEVTSEVLSTENPAMRRIEVSVYRNDDLDRAVVRLSGFVGRR